MIADLPQNREIGASWLVSFVFQCLLSGRFTKYLPALSSFSYGMPVGAFDGALDDFDSLSYDGTNFYATFNTAFITYTSVANIRSNTQASNESIFNQSTIRGISTSDGSLFWAMFEGGGSDLLIPYSSQANLRNNTQGLSGQGDGTDNITTTWDVSLVKGMGFDGSDYYVIRDVNGSDNDILTVHDTIAAVGTDTRLSTTTIDAGAGGTVPNLALGVGLAVTPVPEPATYGLISGLLLLATVHHRRRNRK